MNAQEVTDHLANYVNGFNIINNSQWYVGIASDVEQRLFSDHNVDKADGEWAYAPADTSEIARAVEQYFLDASFDGGPGGGDATTNVVYVYLKAGATNP